MGAWKNLQSYVKPDYEPVSLKSILDVKLDLEDKSHMHYHATITNMAILVHFKENVAHNQLVKSV